MINQIHGGGINVGSNSGFGIRVQQNNYAGEPLSEDGDGATHELIVWFDNISGTSEMKIHNVNSDQLRKIGQVFIEAAAKI